MPLGMTTLPLLPSVPLPYYAAMGTGERCELHQATKSCSYVQKAQNWSALSLCLGPWIFLKIILNRNNEDLWVWRPHTLMTMEIIAYIAFMKSAPILSSISTCSRVTSWGISCYLLVQNLWGPRLQQCAAHCLKPLTSIYMLIARSSSFTIHPTVQLLIAGQLSFGRANQTFWDQAVYCPERRVTAVLFSDRALQCKHAA